MLKKTDLYACQGISTHVLFHAYPFNVGREKYTHTFKNPAFFSQCVKQYRSR